MTTVVQAAPAEARSTALALRLTGNRLGQVAAPAGAGLVAGVAGVAAPFVMLGALLLLSSGVALRSPAAPERAPAPAGRRPGSACRAAPPAEPGPHLALGAAPRAEGRTSRRDGGRASRRDGRGHARRPAVIPAMREASGAGKLTALVWGSGRRPDDEARPEGTR